MTSAVYPGTFDPVTNGHLDLAERARRHFDRLVIGILKNEDKEPLFSVQERVELLREAVAGWENVRVEVFDGLLVDFAKSVGATIIVRRVLKRRSTSRAPLMSASPSSAVRCLRLRRAPR